MVELSYSRVQAYTRCPLLYHMVYDLGLRSGPNGSMALGLSLHRTLASFFSGHNPTRTLERLYEIYDQMWVNEGYASTQILLDTYDSGRKMLQKFFEADQSRTSEVLFTEKEFDLPMNGLKFRGTVDRIDRCADGTYEVIEYKTQGEHWTESRVSNDLQMTFYELGVREGLKLTPVRLRYIFLSNGQTVVTQRSVEQIQAARDTLYRVADSIRLEDYNSNKSYCPKCEFGRRCDVTLDTLHQAAV